MKELLEKTRINKVLALASGWRNQISIQLRRTEFLLQKVLTNRNFNLFWAGGFVLAGLALAVLKNDMQTLGQGGAMLVAGGTLLTNRRMIRIGVRGIHTEDSMIDGGTFESPPSDPEQLEDLKAAHWGFWFLFLGTVVWAFGDVFARFFRGWIE